MVDLPLNFALRLCLKYNPYYKNVSGVLQYAADVAEGEDLGRVPEEVVADILRATVNVCTREELELINVLLELDTLTSWEVSNVVEEEVYL